MAQSLRTLAGKVCNHCYSDLSVQLQPELGREEAVAAGPSPLPQPSSSRCSRSQQVKQQTSEETRRMEEQVAEMARGLALQASRPTTVQEEKENLNQAMALSLSLYKSDEQQAQESLEEIVRPAIHHLHQEYNITATMVEQQDQNGDMSIRPSMRNGDCSFDSVNLIRNPNLSEEDRQTLRTHMRQLVVSEFVGMIDGMNEEQFGRALAITTPDDTQRSSTIDTKEDLKKLLRQYLKDGKYDGDGGDLLPIMISYHLRRPILIVDFRDRETATTTWIFPDHILERESTNDPPLVLARKRFHFEPILVEDEHQEVLLISSNREREFQFPQAALPPPVTTTTAEISPPQTTTTTTTVPIPEIAAPTRSTSFSKQEVVAPQPPTPAAKTEVDEATGTRATAAAPTPSPTPTAVAQPEATIRVPSVPAGHAPSPPPLLSTMPSEEAAAPVLQTPTTTRTRTPSVAASVASKPEEGTATVATTTTTTTATTTTTTTSTTVTMSEAAERRYREVKRLREEAERPTHAPLLNMRDSLRGNVSAILNGLLASPLGEFISLLPKSSSQFLSLLQDLALAPPETNGELGELVDLMMKEGEKCVKEDKKGEAEIFLKNLIFSVSELLTGDNQKEFDRMVATFYKATLTCSTCKKIVQKDQLYMEPFLLLKTNTKKEVDIEEEIENLFRKKEGRGELVDIVCCKTGCNRHSTMFQLPRVLIIAFDEEAKRQQTTKAFMDYKITIRGKHYKLGSVLRNPGDEKLGRGGYYCDIKMGDSSLWRCNQEDRKGPREIDFELLRDSLILGSIYIFVEEPDDGETEIG